MSLKLSLKQFLILSTMHKSLLYSAPLSATINLDQEEERKTEPSIPSAPMIPILKICRRLFWIHIKSYLKSLITKSIMEPISTHFPKKNFYSRLLTFIWSTRSTNGPSDLTSPKPSKIPRPHKEQSLRRL